MDKPEANSGYTRMLHYGEREKVFRRTEAMPPKTSSSIFSEKTLVPMSLVITCLGAVYWIATVANSASVATSEVVEIKRRQAAIEERISQKFDEHAKLLSQVQAQVAGIDAKLLFLVRKATDYPRAEDHRRN